MNNRRGDFSRPKWSATKVAGTALMLILVGQVQAFDPPRIIGVLTSPQEDYHNFATDFCNIGDRNEDGYDDLLISHEISVNDTNNRVYLYLGSNELNNQPAYSFASGLVNHVSRSNLSYCGYLQGHNSTPFFVITSYFQRSDYGIEIYPRNAMPGAEPFLSMTGPMGNGHVMLPDGFRNRPCDFNGDGFDDLITMKAGIGFQVHYGGEEIDTVADWSIYVFVPYWAAGFDFNGDGIGDIQAYTQAGNGIFLCSIFLGGEEPDTVAAVVVNRVEGHRMSDLSQHFSALPDINGDGCDEWGIYWNHVSNDPNDTLPRRDGFLVFMGSEEPDGAFDLNLAGTPDQWRGYGAITGGDFNGDGYGDIVVQTGGSDEDHGEASELMFHFGNRWIFTEEIGEDGREPDLFVEMAREYDGEYAHEYSGYLGAAGDYNGDDVDDFIWTTTENPSALIFAGDRNWRVDVPDVIVPPSQLNLELTIAPNPFNETATIVYSTSHNTNLSLSLYDIQGRHLSYLYQGNQPAGKHTSTINKLPTGLYIVALQAENHKIIRKLVCLR